jgi:hypothetical protein
MIAWDRLLFYLGLAIVEATPAALFLTIAGTDAWGALILVVLGGALADWIVLRRLRPAYQRPALALIAFVAALWVVKGLIPGSGLFTGWGRAVAALLDLDSTQSIPVYLSMLLGLYCFWRGTRLTLHDGVTLHRLFRISTALLMLVVFLRFFSGAAASRLANLATVEVIGYFAIGLLTIALASASEERESELRRMGWRGVASLAGAVVLVIFLGVLVGALFGREAAAMIRLMWQGVILIIALMTAPFIYLFAGIIEAFVRLLNLEQILGHSVLQFNLPDNSQQAAPEMLGIFPPWVQALIRALCAIVPILVLLSLFLLARRRNRREPGADEERESLLTFGGMAEDLLGLLGKLRANRRPEGLRDALARLRGNDPISRIRRSYIRLLLVGEARSLPRLAPQTPREYVRAAGSMLPNAGQPIEALTDAYERARYDPAGPTPADADAAERAWGAIEQADKNSRR